MSVPPTMRNRLVARVPTLIEVFSVLSAFRELPKLRYDADHGVE